MKTIAKKQRRKSAKTVRSTQKVVFADSSDVPAQVGRDT